MLGTRLRRGCPVFVTCNPAGPVALAQTQLADRAPDGQARRHRGRQHTTTDRLTGFRSPPGPTTRTYPPTRRQPQTPVRRLFYKRYIEGLWSRRRRHLDISTRNATSSRIPPLRPLDLGQASTTGTRNRSTPASSARW